jgi:Family of unknown function (DUF6093)
VIIEPADLLLMRTDTESRMRDTCRITVAGSSDGPLDPDTGLPVDVPGAVLYVGKCRYRTAGGVSAFATREVGGDHAALAYPTLSIPVSAPRIPIAAIAAIFAVPDDDPGGHLRLNLRMRIIGQNLATDLTAQRMAIEVVVG